MSAPRNQSHPGFVEVPYDQMLQPTRLDIALAEAAPKGRPIALTDADAERLFANIWRRYPRAKQD